MALTRKFLSALGIDDEKTEQIILAHGETVDGLKTERDKYKADAEKLPAVEAELKDLKAKTEGEDPYKDKFEKLQQEFDTFKADVEQKETAAKQETALRGMLKEIGIPEKRIDAVIKVTDASQIEFDKEGQIKAAEELRNNLKSEWADFIATTKTEGVNSANPPANVKTTMTKEQIRAIPDATARQKAMLENPSLFGLPETNT